MDEHWPLTDDLESLDDYICAILLDNSGGYGGIRILGNGVLQELQAPRFWKVGEQRWRLVVRRWEEICETWGTRVSCCFGGRRGRVEEEGERGERLWNPRLGLAEDYDVSYIELNLVRMGDG